MIKTTALIAAVAALAMPAIAQSMGKWEADLNVNPMDDTRSANVAIANSNFEEALVFFCWDNGNEMLNFMTDEVHSKSDGDYLQLRIDQNTPITISASHTLINGDFNTGVGVYSTYPTFDNIIEEIMNGTERIVAGTSETLYTTFPLSGSRAAITKAREWCAGSEGTA